MQPVGPVPFGQHATHRVGLGGHSAQPVGNGADAGRVQPQAVGHRRRQALFGGIGQILGIGLRDRGFRQQDRIGGGIQGGVLLIGRGLRQLDRRVAGRGAHAGDQVFGGLGHVVHRHQPAAAPL